MTTTPGLSQIAPEQMEPGHADDADSRREWQIFAVAMAGVLLIFGLLHNKWWVPGGDTDLYLVAARNLIKGKKYTFNGLPLNVAPPGWPLLLAGAMKISTSFGFLKMVNLTLLTLFLGVFYWIIRRLVPGPWITAAIIVGTALISHAYELTFWFHSDALFSLLTASSFLIALQIREKQGGNFRAAGLIVLCIAAVCVRWAGVFNWCIIAGILLSGETKPRLTRPWVLVCATFVAFAVTFLALRLAMRLTPEQMRAIKESGIFIDESLRSEAQGYSLDTNLTRKLGLVGEARQRFVGAGRWFSTLFWQPFRIIGSREIDGAGIVVGYFGIFLLGVTVVRAWRKCQWMWVGLGVSCGTLFVMWPDATGRYLIPWTPLLLIALLEPLLVFAKSGGRTRRVALGLFYTFLISAIACNAALFSVEAWVARQHNFYAAYDAGLDHDLISIAHYLIDHGVADNQIAISPKYVNLNHPRYTRWGIRATLALTDRTMLLVPRMVIGDTAKPPAQLAMDWAHQYHVKYYISQPPISPWRVWHFRLGWLQKRVTHKPVIPTRSSWQLWDVSGKDPVEITVPPVHGWPTHVPDL